MLITDKESLRKYETGQRIWQGIPSIEVTAKGRIFACWYSGATKETLGNYCVLVKSDDGANFSEPIAVTEYGMEHRCFDPCLWIDPLGRLWFTWSVQPDNGLYAVVCEEPDAEDLVWSPVRYIGHDVMMNKPIALTTGEWLFPLAVWGFEGAEKCFGYNPAEEKGSFVYKTSDNGQTFQRMGAADVDRRSFDEHMVVELRDGRLIMLVRTAYGIGRSYSWDRGKTWSRGENAGLGGPCSRFHICRLKSGRLLLVNHVNFQGRNNLTVQLSEDDGKTWNCGLLLDGRNDVSYPDVKEAEDGFIYIVYDRERGGYKSNLEEAMESAREILYAKVTEVDILAGELVNEGSKLKQIINKLGMYLGENKNPYDHPKQYSTHELAAKLMERYEGTEILEHIFDLYPLHCTEIHELDFSEVDGKIEHFRDSGCSSIVLLTEILILVRKLAGQDELANPVIQRMKRWISDHLTEELSLGEMAKACGLSRYYMCHLFKKHTGTTVVNYRNELRLTEAKRMLIGSDTKIAEIATACGFDSVSYFTELFVMSEGITPTAYRKFHS